MFRFTRVFILAAALAIPALAGHDVSASAVGQSNVGLSPVGPKQYYLALGDSLAFGFQPLFDWNKGYAQDWFNTRLKHEGTQSLIDLGCNGETTTTFIRGGCLVPVHRVPYRTSQLDAALRFIRHNRGKVSPVTVDIGANDVLAGLKVNGTTCIVASTAVISNIETTLDTNYTYILTQLKQALTVNGTQTGDLITMNYYNPFQNLCANNPKVAQLFHDFNQHLQADADAVGVLWADVTNQFEIGNLLPGTPLNTNITGTPNGLCPTQRPYVTPTAYTWICSSHTFSVSNIHPTTLGYQQIAAAFQARAGY